MLNKREQELIKAALAEAEILNARALGELLPEEKKLLETKYPSGGRHTHDNENPFGMHRHLPTDQIDAPHTHTPQNPGGEHAHGENKGKRLIDGEHYHGDHKNSLRYSDYGYHSHLGTNKFDKSGPVVVKPSSPLSDS